MFKKLLEMNEKFNNIFKSFETTNDKLNNILRLSFALENEELSTSDEFKIEAILEKEIETFNKNERLPVEKFIELTKHIKKPVTIMILFGDLYIDKAREIHDIIINNLIKNSNYQVNEDFMSDIYAELFGNYRTQMINHLTAEYVDDIPIELHDKIDKYIRNHKLAIDDEETYNPPAEFMEIINQLKPEIKKQFLDICHRSDYFKYGNIDLLKSKIKAVHDELKSQKVLDKNIMNAFMIYLALLDKRKPDTVAFLRMLFYFWGESKAINFMINYAKDNKGKNFSICKYYVPTHEIETELRKYIANHPF